MGILETREALWKRVSRSASPQAHGWATRAESPQRGRVPRAATGTGAGQGTKEEGRRLGGECDLRTRRAGHSGAGGHLALGGQAVRPGALAPL